MNNEQFRRLLFDNDQASKPKGASQTGHSPTGDNASPKRGSSGGQTRAPATLGSRMRSSIPMTPYVSSPIFFDHGRSNYNLTKS